MHRTRLCIGVQLQEGYILCPTIYYYPYSIPHYAVGHRMVQREAKMGCNGVTFNERFIQYFAFCTQVLGTYFYLQVACLTKSSSHTSLNLTNSGLVVTTLGPNNFG